MYIVLYWILGYFITGAVIRILLNKASIRRSNSIAYEEWSFCLIGWPMLVMLLCLVFWIDLLIDSTKLLLKLLKW